MPVAEWTRTTKRIVVVGLVIIFLLLLYLFRALLPALLIATVLAYILKPVADLLVRRTRMPRLLAVLLVFLALVALVATIPAALVPYLADQVRRIDFDLQRLTEDVVAYLSQPIVILGFSLNPRDLLGDMQGPLQNLVQSFASQTLTILLGIASSLIWIIATLVIAFYLVKDADKLRAFLDRVAPPGHAEELRRLRDQISRVWSSFFRGQVTLAFVIGIAVWICMAAVGMPSAGLMGLIAGCLEVIPNFGPVLATIPAALMALIRGSNFLPLSNFWFAVLVVVIYTLIQQVENAYLVPRIMGRRLQLHPAVVFVAVLGGGLVFGAVGFFLAAPVIATARVFLGYTSAKLLDQEPFPQAEEGDELYPGEIDAILFDLDGTLAETDNEAVEHLAHRLQVLRWFLLGRDPDEAARRFLMASEGPATRLLGLLDRIGLDDDVLDMGNRLRRLRGLHGPLNFKAVDGIEGTLRELNSRYHLAIVSTRSHREAVAFLTQHELTPLIRVITGRDDTWRIKPHPSPILHTAEKLGIAVERCLMVGDTTADMRAARAAGARAAGVLCGFGNRDELERAGADLILDTTRDLLGWL
jgi:predicted PurR-regulated permease PerM/phosphoglycolate phosphatase-like HAD superfamily hydrolase